MRITLLRSRSRPLKLMAWDLRLLTPKNNKVCICHAHRPLSILQLPDCNLTSLTYCCSTTPLFKTLQPQYDQVTATPTGSSPQQTNHDTSDYDSQDEEESAYRKLKREFQRREEQYLRRIRDLERDKQQIQTEIKRVENEVQKNQDRANIGGAYAHIDETSRRTVQQKDLIVSNLMIMECIRFNNLSRKSALQRDRSSN